MIKEKLESYKTNFQKFVESEKNKNNVYKASVEEEVMITNAREVHEVRLRKLFKKYIEKYLTNAYRCGILCM